MCATLDRHARVCQAFQMLKEKARIWHMTASEKLLIPANVTRNMVKPNSTWNERNLLII